MPRIVSVLLAVLLAARILFPSAPVCAATPEDGDRTPDNLPSEAPGYAIQDLRRLADAIVRTGVRADGITALYRPQFLSVSDASLSMDDDEVVFVVEYPGRTRIYPQRILVWHEVINDVLPDASGNMPPRPVPGVAESAGENYSITYSPLTGTVVGFRSLAGKFPSTFGVTGNLLNANTVLYDRISQSLWCQLLAVSIEGPMRGKRLERIPVLWATWKGVKTRYLGKAEVLSRSTGYSRSYGKDPYGSYQTRGNYYDDARLLFAVSRLDPRLPPKKRILGLEIEDAYGAVQVDAVHDARVLNFSLGVAPLAAVYDAELEAVRIFDRRLDGDDKRPLTFAIFEDKLIDEQTKSEWTPLGICTYGRLRDKKLTPVYSMNSMWFAWAAFHKGTEVIPPMGQ